jgi:hypothetical protein
MTTRERFRFFLEHAGYATPPGRAACALELARAEQGLECALAYGEASVQWLDDDVPYDPGDAFTEDEARERSESGAWTGPVGSIVAIGDEQHPRAVASLWGVVLDSRELGDPYARVVVAELAFEAIDEARRERDERERAARMDVATREAPC